MGTPAATHFSQDISGRIFNDLYLFRRSKIVIIEHLESTEKLEGVEVTPPSSGGFLVVLRVWNRRSHAAGQLHRADFLIPFDAFSLGACFTLLKMRF